MKKIIAAGAAFMLAMACVGCSTGEDAASTEASSEPAAQAQKASDTEFPVEIKESAVVKDYDGNPALVVGLSWTNNSEETTAFETALMVSAFQDGVELDYAITDGSTGYDLDASWKEVRPGTTQDVWCCFALTSESDVEVEVTEWLSLNDDILASEVFSVA